MSRPARSSSLSTRTSRICRKGSPRSSASASSTIAWSCTASPSTAAADRRPNMLRVSLRAAGLVLLFLACLGPHLFSKWVLGRSGWPRRFLGAAASIVGLQVRVAGEPTRPHTLLIVNHVSWLDILAISSATGCTFVSKDQLGHGFIHWLADQNHTIYVGRS